MEFLKKNSLNIFIALVIGVVLYFAYKEYKKMEAAKKEVEPGNTGIVPPNIVEIDGGENFEYQAGDFNLDGMPD